MNEEKVFFQAGRISIEGLYAETDGPRGAIVSHPHSRMGGSMWNNVVETLVAALHENGFSTLRFNFRGVGKSGGIFDNGHGEQDDLQKALDFLKEKAKEKIVLAGYSFGAWVNAKVLARGAAFDNAIFVSPPLNMMKFDNLSLIGKVGLVICGDQDQFCSLDALRGLTSDINCRLEIVPGADHFYFGKEQSIVGSINAYFR